MNAIPGYGTNRLSPQYPVNYTPDAVTGAVTPGATYQPLPGPNGEIRGDFQTHPGEDGFWVTSPMGTNTPWFDGNTYWNQGEMGSDVSQVINLNNVLKDQASQYVQYSAGLSPYPPNFAFPYDYPKFPGTPANPYTLGAGTGLAGAYGAMGMPMGGAMGMGGVVGTPGGVTNAIPNAGVTNPTVNNMTAPPVTPGQ
jgi:hypothetical protein